MTDPTPQHPAERVELYTHETMVSWLHPLQLLATGVRSGLAAMIGGFADARLIQAALHPHPAPEAASPVPGLDARDTVWIDYVADTGDGWDSTYSVFWTMGRAQLQPPGVAHPLPRADLIVFGGDQVYPTPAGGGYRTRLVDPFRSAFPSAIPEPDRPDGPALLAIPGNHDWYDGLKGFTALFCGGRPLGACSTHQRHSYFAQRLAHGWWLWGLDLQLESEMDGTQLEYFTAIARSELAPGDRVILCTPEPSWIDESARLARQRAEEHAGPLGAIGSRWLTTLEKQAPRFKSLSTIEGLIRERAASTEVVLAGDLHHYAHYRAAETTAGAPPHRITCGGGGAFLYGTHDLAERLDFHGDRREREHYRLKATFPEAPDSRGLRDRFWMLALRNPSFCLLLGVVDLLLIWAWQGASLDAHRGAPGLSMFERLRAPSPGVADTVFAMGDVLASSPSVLLLSLALAAAFSAFTALSAGVRRLSGAAGGFLHGLLHLGAATAMMALFARLGDPARWPLPDPWAGVVGAGIALVVTLAAGSALGGLLMGVWLALTNRLFGWHEQESMSAQAIGDYKCFLRMRIDATGLTIYPLGLRRACRRWRPGDGVRVLTRKRTSMRVSARAGAGARYEPLEPLPVELIETPIHVSTLRGARTPASGEGDPKR